MAEADHIWRVPAGEVVLARDEVHVWRSSLLLPDREIRGLKCILSAEEVEKAERFYFEKDRNRHIIVHAVLRLLLAQYLKCETGQIHFAINAYGKPYLTMPAGAYALHFNLSHSHGLALYAFSFTREVGVDIEYMRWNIDYLSLAEHYFSVLENAMLREVPDVLRAEAFFRCWARKEAYIKARGKGLSLPLDLFDVSLKPGDPAALLGSREDPPQMKRWSMRELMPDSGYAAALTVEGHDWRLRCWHYPF